MCRIVAERGANLGNEIDEVLLDHERVGPEAFLKLQFRQRLRSLATRISRSWYAFGESAIERLHAATPVRPDPARNRRTIRGRSFQVRQGRTGPQGDAGRSSSTIVRLGMIDRDHDRPRRPRDRPASAFSNGFGDRSRFDAKNIDAGRPGSPSVRVDDINDLTLLAPPNRDVRGGERRHGLRRPPSMGYRTHRLPDRPRTDVVRGGPPWRPGRRLPSDRRGTPSGISWMWPLRSVVPSISSEHDPFRVAQPGAAHPLAPDCLWRESPRNRNQSVAGPDCLSERGPTSHPEKSTEESRRRGEQLATHRAPAI